MPTTTILGGGSQTDLGVTVGTVLGGGPRRSSSGGAASNSVVSSGRLAGGPGLCGRQKRAGFRT
jgi:hypothetical protein